jgi:EpsI family protein
VDSDRMHSRLTTRGVVLAAVLLAAAAMLPTTTDAESVPARDALPLLPVTVGEWRGVDAPALSADVRRVLGVEDYVLRTYRGGRGDIGLYAGYYTTQSQGDAIHSPMNCLPGAGWVPSDYARVQIASAGGRTIEVNRYVIRKGEARQIALYWYEGRGRAVANEYESRALLVWDSLRRNRSDGALVRITAPLARGQTVEDAERQAIAFGAELLPHLSRFIPE